MCLNFVNGPGKKSIARFFLDKQNYKLKKYVWKFTGKHGVYGERFSMLFLQDVKKQTFIIVSFKK